MLENLDYIPTPWGNAAKHSGGETAPLNSPNFTGIPTAPTAAPGTNTTQIATTEFVTYAITLTGTTINDHINSTTVHGATSSNTASRIVLRDGNGNFSAGTITANLTGVASEAIKLQTARNINGIPFDGTTDITIATGVPSVNIETNYNVPDLAIGKSILIRKISAYNGTAITISPPFGATFEGLASLSLYGQYSFVELERISSTVFAVKDLKDEYVWDSVTGAKVRKRWGQLSEKEYFGTTAAVAGGSVTVSIDIPVDNVRSISGSFINDLNEVVPFGYLTQPGTNEYYINAYIIRPYSLKIITSSVDSKALSCPYKVVIRYKEW